jgi:solute carrier family 6 amino acid/orphan transporter-like 15/16/17/18/20
MSVGDITQDEYIELMNSHVLNLNHTLMNETFVGDHVLKNCSMAQELDQAAEGTGLAFIVMADVFTKLPGAPFWSLLFFSMLLSLGLGSQIGILEGMIGTLFDMPQLKHIKKPILTGTSQQARLSF